MRNKSKLSVALILAAGSLWGTAGIFVKSLYSLGLTSMQLVFERVTFSFIILALILTCKDIKLFKIKLKDIPLFMGSGLISIIMFNYCYYRTMSLTSLSVAAVLLYTAPFFVVIMSLFIFKEKLTLNKTIACICAFVGCCLVSGLIGSSQKITGQALMFGILTGLGYSFYTIFGGLLIAKKYSSITITFYTFLFATIGSLPLVNIPQTVKSTFISPKILIVSILMALFNTVFPYLLYTAGLKGIDASKAPIIATVEPVVATVIGVVIYKENLNFQGVLGIILVLSAVVILNYKSGDKCEKS